MDKSTDRTQSDAYSTLGSSSRPIPLGNIRQHWRIPGWPDLRSRESVSQAAQNAGWRALLLAMGWFQRVSQCVDES